jgi:hypothetical protein
MGNRCQRILIRLPPDRASGNPAEEGDGLPLPRACSRPVPHLQSSVREVERPVSKSWKTLKRVPRKNTPLLRLCLRRCATCSPPQSISEHPVVAWHKIVQHSIAYLTVWYSTIWHGGNLASRFQGGRTSPAPELRLPGGRRRLKLRLTSESSPLTRKSCD